MSAKETPSFIRPDYNEPYLPKVTSRKFFSWVNLNIPREQNKTPRMHYQMIDELVGTDEINVQAMVHRGGAKSTVMTNYLPLYVAVHGELPYFGKVHNLIIFSATIEQAIDQLRGIRDIWDNSDSLGEFLTLAKDKRGKTVADKVDYLCWENKQGHRIHIQAKGAGQSMRGTKKEGHRPQLLIFDDILPDSILTSDTERKKLRTWFYSTVQNSVDITHYKKIVVGTPMTDDDILMTMLRSKSFKSVKFPIADKFPVPVEEMVTSWKDRFTPDRVMKQYLEAKEMGAEADFFREMMLEVINDDLRIFKDNYFRPYSYKQKRHRLHELNFFTTIDFAVSQKQEADYTAVITIGVDKDNNWFIVRCDVKRMNPSEAIETLFKHVREFKPLEVRGEKAAIQQVLNHFIELKMEEEQLYFNLQPLTNNSTQSKEYRIMGLQPKMKKKQVFFPHDIDEVSIGELIYELKGYTKAGKTTAHDDAADCLANFLDPDFIVAPTTGQERGTEVAKGITSLDLSEAEINGYPDDEEYEDEYYY
jgi:predicted phage terminase large subunit-like protein